jgi:type I restriction enzyme S subunit
VTNQLNKQSFELPKGWAWVKLGEVVEPSRGKVDPAEVQKTNYIGLEHIERDTGKLLGFGSSADVRSTKNRFLTGDLLYGKLRPYLNKVHVASFEGVCSTDILVFAKGLFVSNKFLLYRFLSGDFVRYASQNVSGVQHPRVDFATLSRFGLLIPPTAEQDRIVSRIEELFALLDAGLEALGKVKVQLKRYSQAVLKHALEGKLTEEWRKTHKEELEAPEKLMERITAAKTETQGKKLREPPKLDVDNLPDIPYEWCWQNFSLVIKKVKRGPSLKCNQEGRGFRYITSGNLQDGRLRLDLDYKFLDNFPGVDSCRLLPKDLILNCVNSLEQIGKSAIFEKEHGEAVVGFNNYALELDTDFILPEYANAVCQSDFFKAQLYFLIKRAVNQVSFATRELDFVAIPLPSLSEQRVILDKVERYFSLADEVNSDLETNLKKAEDLRRSILKTAFEGKLVSQDPGDEPAEKLVERIKAERAKSKGEGATNSKNKSQLELSTYVK